MKLKKFIFTFAGIACISLYAFSAYETLEAVWRTLLTLVFLRSPLVVVSWMMADGFSEHESLGYDGILLATKFIRVINPEEPCDIPIVFLNLYLQ